MMTPGEMEVVQQEFGSFLWWFVTLACSGEVEERSTKQSCRSWPLTLETDDQRLLRLRGIVTRII